MVAATSALEAFPEGIGPRPLWEERVRGILEVAAQVRTGVPLDELTRLLPREAPETSEELAARLSSRPEIARLCDGRAFSPRTSAPSADLSRSRRGSEYLSAAEELKSRTFRPVLPLLLTLGVTGSAAYGEPEEGDDLDLLVITRRGALWTFLAYAYLSLRSGRGPMIDGRAAAVCLNYVREAGSALQDFARPQDFLFAREALTSRILHGERYYGGLLASAGWMEREIPRLYASRRGVTGRVRSTPAPWPLRLLNLALFPVLAAYLQAQGLRRNAQFRARGESDEVFRTDTRLGSVSFISRRFERRRRGYEAGRPPLPPAPRSTVGSTTAPSAGTAATLGG